MKRTLVTCAAALLLIASAIYAFGDIARPKPSPGGGKVVFHTSLVVTPDSKASEARLQISQETLKQIQQAAMNNGGPPSVTQGIIHSSPRTIMAGLFMFLAVSFAGVWFARSSQRRNHKAVAAALLIAIVFGIATVIVRANAGPPGYLRWEGLPQNLTKGRPTGGGLQIEIVPGDDGMKLIVPLKKKENPDW